MGKKIIIGGAGHGGLICAKILAEKGYDVTVFEKQERDSLGYDWHDCLPKSTFEKCEITLPDDFETEPFYAPSYKNPAQSVTITRPEYAGNDLVFADRKKLINFLIDSAEKAGAKINFGVNILRSVCDAERVLGIVINNDNQISVIKGDLVIDACGVNSPIRSSLPSWFNIKNTFSNKVLFNAYRIYLKKEEKECEPVPRYEITFFHCNHTGMDWIIDGKNYVDILVGSFDKLTDEQIKESISDYRKLYPCVTDIIVRGGSRAVIPITRPISRFVYNGYAAVGDSAGMTEPLSGSGIMLSMIAGKILSEVIMNDTDCRFTKETLWKYQYNYLNTRGLRYLNDDNVKKALSSLTPSDMNYLMENNILGTKEFSGGSAAKYSKNDILEKLALLKKPSILKVVVKAGINIAMISKIKAMLPKEYDEKKISEWEKIYGTF